MKPPQRILAIHDLSGFGHTSLLAAIPILYRMGIEVAALPTALLSTNTEHKDFRMFDTTALMEAHLAHWQGLKQKYDAIYSGFLGNPKQVELLLQNLARLKKPEALFLLDPVLADNGRLYSCYTWEMVAAMRKLLPVSDIITPNLSEAAFLLGNSYPESSAEVDIISWCRQLSDYGPRYVVITSAPDFAAPSSTLGSIKPHNPKQSQGVRQFQGIAYYDRDTQNKQYMDCNYLPISYPGTGDCFSSLLLGGVLNGLSVLRSALGAAKFLHWAIELSMGIVADTRDGIALATALARNPLDFFV